MRGFDNTLAAFGVLEKLGQVFFGDEVFTRPEFKAKDAVTNGEC